MGLEIERKFLVRGNDWRQNESATYRQGYLNIDEQRTVRIREDGSHAYLTVKGHVEGITRKEFEYRIPLEDALDMLDNLCEHPLIEKRRYKLEYGGLVWEVDEFFNENQGLTLAEVELVSEDQQIERPPWLGEEVTDDERYYNSNLVHRPYSHW